MKTKLLLFLLLSLGISGIARSGPIQGAVIQTWTYDSEWQSMKVRVNNVSGKTITALSFEFDQTVDGQKRHGNFTRDFLFRQMSREHYKALGIDIMGDLGHLPLVANESYEEKLPVASGFSDFSAVLSAVIYDDGTSETTNPQMLQMVLNVRKAVVNSIQKATDIIRASASREEAVANLQRFLDDWRNAGHPADYTEGEFSGALEELQMKKIDGAFVVPDLAFYTTQKDKEKTLVRSQIKTKTEVRQ